MKNSLFTCMRTRVWPAALVLAALLAFAPSVSATNGYFSHGIGLKYKAMGGAGVGLSLSPIGMATNPASLAFSRPAYEIELMVFNPRRDYTVIGSPSFFPQTFGLAQGTVNSGSENFLIPCLAGSWSLSGRANFGIAVFGNGGMNTDYAAETFFGGPVAGVDLMQLFIAPTLAIEVVDGHALGVSAIVAYQRFSATGLAAFSGYSSDPANLSDRGYDGSYGYGVKAGYQGQVLPFLRVGGAWQSRVWMTEFDKYAGLFAESGDFDIPENWTAGAAVTFGPATIAADVQHVRYSTVAAVGNGLMPNLMTGKLGSDNGAGFGWEDVTVYKAGLAYDATAGWTLRTGYAYGDQPIPEREVLFNILAPGVIKQHLTFGLTRTLAGGREVNVALMRAFSGSVAGPNPMEAPGQQEIELRMDQWELGVGFSF